MSPTSPSPLRTQWRLPQRPSSASASSAPGAPRRTRFVGMIATSVKGIAAPTARPPRAHAQSELARDASAPCQQADGRRRCLPGRGPPVAPPELRQGHRHPGSHPGRMLDNRYVKCPGREQGGGHDREQFGRPVHRSPSSLHGHRPRLSGSHGRSEQEAALGHRQHPRGLAGQELAVGPHLVRLGIHLDPLAVVVVDHRRQRFTLSGEARAVPGRPSKNPGLGVGVSPHAAQAPVMVTRTARRVSSPSEGGRSRLARLPPRREARRSGRTGSPTGCPATCSGNPSLRT
jgi:hypothetical protein